MLTTYEVSHIFWHEDKISDEYLKLTVHKLFIFCVYGLYGIQIFQLALSELLYRSIRQMLTSNVNENTYDDDLSEAIMTALRKKLPKLQVMFALGILIILIRFGFYTY